MLMELNNIINYYINNINIYRFSNIIQTILSYIFIKFPYFLQEIITFWILLIQQIKAGGNVFVQGLQ